MKQFTFMLLVVCSLELLSTSCVAQSATLLNQVTNGTTVVTQSFDSASQDLSQAHNTLGFHLLKSLSKGESGNVFISPLSISLALSMVYNGASGETKKAMTQTLQFHNMPLDRINQQSHEISVLLKNADPGVELEIANSLWIRQGIWLQPDFLNTVKNDYNAEIASLDFNNPNSVKVINSWVSQNTKGKIPTIINSIPHEMVLYLINGVYFKGDWTISFDSTLTRDRTFIPASGGTIMRPFMYRKDKIQYLETDAFQSVSLPYGKNQRLSMEVFLPKDLPQFIDQLNTGNWNSWMGQYQPTEGTLLLPRFKMEYERDLKSSLSRLGMGIAFEDHADFSQMRPQRDISISEVKHKTYIKVNEQGTEAAAVTSVGMRALAMPVMPRKTFYMEVNKPFVIAIRDNQNHEVLFLGIIQRP